MPKKQRILVLSSVVCPVFFSAVGCAGRTDGRDPSIDRSFWAADQSTCRRDSERRANIEQEREFGRNHAIGAQEGISTYWQSMIRYYSEGYTPGYSKNVCEHVGIRRFVQMIEQPAEDASALAGAWVACYTSCGNRESTGP